MSAKQTPAIKKEIKPSVKQIEQELISSVDFLCKTSMGEVGADIKDKIIAKDRK